MKKIISIVIIIIVLSLLASCTFFIGIRGSDNVVDLDITNIPDGYNKIYLGVSIKGVITQSASYNLEISSNDNLIQYLVYEIVDDTLKIYLDPSNNYHNVKVTAIISAPNLVDLYAHVSSIVDLSGFTENNMLITANTSAQINASDLTINDTFNMDFETSAIADINNIYIDQVLNINSSTSSQITISGTGKPNLSLNADTSSKTILKNIPINDADVYLGTSAQAEISMDGGLLNADLGTSAILRVFGTYTAGDINLGTSAQLIDY